MSLSPRARALFRSAAARHEPRKEDAERILSLLGPKLAAAATVAAGTTIAASAAGSAAKAGAAGTAGTAAAKVATVALSTKILAAVGIASAVAMGALEYETTRPASSAVPVVASSSPASPRPLVSPAEARPSARRPPALAEPSSNDAPAAIPVLPAPETPATLAARAARAARGAPAAAPAAANAPAPVALAAAVAPATSTPSTPPGTAEITPAASIAAELALLRQSQQELRSGDASAALATLDVHARRHPAGALGQERMATRVFVLCALGRTVEASATADAFLSAHPTSPHASRVRTSCARAK